MELGNWTDNPCWYASVQDAGRTAVVLGPFRTEADCRLFAYHGPADGGDPGKHHMLTVAAECDPKAHFYAWGMVKLANGHKTGALNCRMPAEVQAALTRGQAA